MHLITRRAAPLALAALVAATAAATAEAATAYTCKIRPSKQTNLLPEVLFIGHDADKGRIVVSDPIILFFNDNQPTEGRLVRQTSSALTFAWSVPGVQLREGKAVTLRYRAEIKPARKSIYVTVDADDFRNTGVRGACAVEEVKGGS